MFGLSHLFYKSSDSTESNQKEIKKESKKEIKESGVPGVPKNTGYTEAPKVQGVPKINNEDKMDVDTSSVPPLRLQPQRNTQPWMYPPQFQSYYSVAPQQYVLPSTQQQAYAPQLTYIPQPIAPTAPPLIGDPSNPCGEDEDDEKSGLPGDEIVLDEKAIYSALLNLASRIDDVAGNMKGYKYPSKAELEIELGQVTYSTGGHQRRIKTATKLVEDVITAIQQITNSLVTLEKKKLVSRKMLVI